MLDLKLIEELERLNALLAERDNYIEALEHSLNEESAWYETNASHYGE